MIEWVGNGHVSHASKWEISMSAKMVYKNFASHKSTQAFLGLFSRTQESESYPIWREEISLLVAQHVEIITYIESVSTIYMRRRTQNITRLCVWPCSSLHLYINIVSHFINFSIFDLSYIFKGPFCLFEYFTEDASQYSALRFNQSYSFLIVLVEQRCFLFQTAAKPTMDWGFNW